MANEIDVEILISLVQSRPTIWDKTLTSYKNRKETKKAWREVCAELNRHYEELNDMEKNKYGKDVMKRWVNIRDSYHKYRKREKFMKNSDASGSSTRKYIYFDQLQFLNKILCERPTDDISIDQAEKYLTDYTEKGFNAEGTGSRFKASRSSRKRKIDEIDIKPSPASAELNDRHTCFFKGIIPSLSSFNDDEILEFQMGTLQLITAIKQRRLRAPRDTSIAFESLNPSQKQYELQIEYDKGNEIPPKSPGHQQFVENSSSSEDIHSDYDLTNNFPTKKDQFKRWVTVVRRQRRESDWAPSKSSRICSNHFKDSDKYLSKKGRLLLKKTAVPEAPEMKDGTSRRKSCGCPRYSSDTNENVSNLDMSSEDEDDTQLTGFENPNLPGTKYPGLDYSSDNSDADENPNKTDKKTHEINTDTNLNKQHEIKIEIQDTSAHATSCDDPSKPGPSKPKDTSGTEETGVEYEHIKIEYDEPSPNIGLYYVENGTVDHNSTRENNFVKFGEYVVNMLNKMPLPKALDLQMQITNLITSMMDQEDAVNTVQIKTEYEPGQEEN